MHRAKAPLLDERRVSGRNFPGRLLAGQLRANPAMIARGRCSCSGQGRPVRRLSAAVPAAANQRPAHRRTRRHPARRQPARRAAAVPTEVAGHLCITLWRARGSGGNLPDRWRHDPLFDGVPDAAPVGACLDRRTNGPGLEACGGPRLGARWRRFRPPETIPAPRALPARADVTKPVVPGATKAGANAQGDSKENLWAQ